MKAALILILAGVSFFSWMNISALKEELEGIRQDAVFLEERNERLQIEFNRLAITSIQKEQFLNELEQAINSLEKKMPLSALERYIPGEVLDEMRPVIERLYILQGAIRSGEQVKERESK